MNKTPLTVDEVEAALYELSGPFFEYMEKVEHLGAISILVSFVGGHTYSHASNKPEDVPFDLLAAAANMLDGRGYSFEDVADFFFDFLEKQEKPDPQPKRVVHPFEHMRMVMVKTIDALMPVLRPMHEFDDEDPEGFRIGAPRSLSR
jgi:hypothetical protein